ncbi:MAG: hypothetical protein M3P91_03255 [Actinomycetota bacterium]|nr:hypothetical protein [Actinomycetota bacterium]
MADPAALDPSTVQPVHDELAVLARRTDEREERVPLSVEQLVQRGIGLVALAAAAFVLPWVAAVHVHAVAILLAPALLSIRPRTPRPRRAAAAVRQRRRVG